jgi:hypothetical protein
VYRHAGLLLMTVAQLAQRADEGHFRTLQAAHDTAGILLPWSVEHPWLEEQAAALQQHLPQALECLLALLSYSTANDPHDDPDDWCNAPLFYEPAQELAAIVLADNATAAAAAALLAQPARMRR